MFDRFTDNARKAFGMARRAVFEFPGDASICPEHVLLGLLAAPCGAITALKALGIDSNQVWANVKALRAKPREPTPRTEEAILRNVRAQLAEINCTVRLNHAGQIPFSPDAKNVLERALGEAEDLGHTVIGTEHLLFALCADRESIAGHALVAEGLRCENVREQIVALARGRPG